MQPQAPAIVRLSERILVEIESAVIGFARKHKFGVGDELRADARMVARRAQRAWRQRDRRTQLLEELGNSIDDLKLSAQVAQRIGSFSSFAQFEAIARLVNDLGRQCGGWQKQHLKSESRRAAPSAGRAPILSAGDAPRGVQP